MKRLLILSMILLMTMMLLATEPVSKEANIIQRYVNGDVELQAVGIYNSPASSASKRKADVKKVGVEMAILDAKKAAIYYLIHSAPDPILVDGEARARFITRGAFIFEPASVDRLVSYVNPDNRNQVELNGGQGKKITKILRVNRDYIIRDLTNAGIFDHGYASSDSALEKLEIETDKIPVATVGTNTPVANDPFARLEAQTAAVGVAGRTTATATTPNSPITSTTAAPTDSRISAFRNTQTTTNTTPAISIATVQSTIDDICKDIPAGSSIAIMDIAGNGDTTQKNETYEAISNALTNKGYRVISKNNADNANFVFEPTLTDGTVNIKSKRGVRR